MKRAHLLFLLWAGFLGALTTLLNATTLDPVTFQQLIRDANFIFEGSVVSIDHRNSDVESAEHVQLPHTFVTFKIDRSYKGRSEHGTRITLRFLGGPDGKGKTLVVAGIPEFQVGEQNILFVRANGSEICPTVGWAQGRFRIADDAVLTDAGLMVGIDARDNLVAGRNLLKARRLNREDFRTFMEQQIRKLVSSQAMVLLSAEKSPNLLERFYVKADKPAAPPADSHQGGLRK